MARTYRRGWWRRAINAVVRALLGLGVGPSHTYLLTVRGRVTGRPYSTPVTLVEYGDVRWLVAPYGEVGWVRNARVAGEVTLRRGRSAERLRLVDVSPAEAAPVLKRYVRDIPITRPYFDVTPASSLPAFAAEAPRHPVFRLLPVTES